MRVQRARPTRWTVFGCLAALGAAVLIAAGCGLQPGPIPAPDTSDQFDGDTGLPPGGGGDNTDGNPGDPGTGLSNLWPTVDVGGGLIKAREGSFVTLNAVADDPDGDALSLAWEQLSGIIVFDPSRVESASPSFVVPDITSNLLADSILTFEVTVEDGRGGIATAQVIVQILMAGDATGDNVVDNADEALVQDYFINGGTPGAEGEGDLNGDGLVDLVDLTLVLEQMGRVLI